MEIHKWLKLLASQNGSDLYLSTGAPPCAKFEGKLKPIGKSAMKPGEIRAIAYEMMDETQQQEFESELEMNLATSIAGHGRFRVNIFVQRNEVAMVCRNLREEMPDWKALGLPEAVSELVMKKRGLILVVGGTGSGKSTSLAALIDHRNNHSSGHIVTIEDPIEFVHRHKKSIVNQREVGVDTRSWHNALKNTLRQAPDVVLVGEIRDRETMEHALAFSETGHLCLSTLHSTNANQALDRIVNFFPEDRRPQLLMDLANNLQAVVSQRLVPTVDGARCAAIEVFLSTPIVKETILKGDLAAIKGIMEKSGNLGMQTFDQALYHLVESGKVREEEALKYADSANNLRLMIKFSEDNPGGKDAIEFSLEDSEDHAEPVTPEWENNPIEN